MNSHDLLSLNPLPRNYKTAPLPPSFPEALHLSYSEYFHIFNLFKILPGR